MGSTIAIIGFAIWPDLPRIQSLNHAIKTLPTVYLLIDHEKSNGMVKLELVSVLLSWLSSRSLDGGLMVHREVDCPGNTTRRKSSL